MSDHANRRPLVDLAEISAGHPIRSAVDELPRGPTGIVQMRNVDADAGVDWSDVARVELPRARRFDHLALGDVIFSTRGTRTYAVAVTETPFPAVCSPHFFVLRVRKAAIDPRFLAWQINQEPAQDYLQREATGSHILNIRREVVERMEIMVPSRARQGAIVAFADAVAREKRVLSGLLTNRQRQMTALAVGLHSDIRK
ncbi:MAG TPA: restriction endonuclease subunit S [Caulobacteraceae bacterium]|jgi:hypothetical protein